MVTKVLKLYSTKQNLLIALDLRKVHHKALLIINLKFVAKSAEIKTANLSVSLKELKIAKS